MVDVLVEIFCSCFDDCGCEGSCGCFRLLGGCSRFGPLVVLGLREVVAAVALLARQLQIGLL